MSNKSEISNNNMLSEVKSNMKNYIGKKGYTIPLKNFTEEQICKIKEDLTFKPFRPKGYGPDTEPFSIYGISKNKMFIPKFYGLEKFGKPKEIKLSQETKISLEFNGKLRENQIEPVNACLKAAEDTGGGILCLGCGFGKCLGKDTPIMMYDGTIKMVQYIKTGDLLMGDDSTPRNVLSTCQGKEQLYKVIPKKGDSYIVNESHILSLKSSNKTKKLKKGDIIDIPVKNYLKLQSSYNGKKGQLLGYKVPVNFPEKKVDFDPYIIGLWLGSSSKGSIFSNNNATIIKYLKQNLGKYNLYLKFTGFQYEYSIDSINENIKFKVNSLITELIKQNLLKNKHIPIDYKCNSRDIRLKVLAGIIDTNGSIINKKINIIQKNEKLLDDIIFISRSLGFVAYKKKCQKSFIYKDEKKIETYYKTTIYGKGLDEIPVLIKRKKIEPQIKIKNSLVTRIHLEKLEVGDYYGFEIDGNHRFLLGDFTVTHNTSIALYLIAKLGVKALVIVNKEFLMDQWKERIHQFLPEARIGILRQKKINIDNKDIVIAMLQSVAMCDYNSSIYESFGISFYDEVHCVPSKIFSKALRKINTKYHFGLSATPNRADGMSSVTKLYIGPIIYEIDKKKAKKNPKKLQVFTVAFDKLPNNNLYRSLSNYKGKPDVIKMISNITKCPNRLALISMILRYFIINDKRHILVLSDRIQYLRDIEEKIKKDYYIQNINNIKNNLNKNISIDISNITSKQIDNIKLPFKIGYYIGGMKEKERKDSETADLILASYSMAKEAMDIPILDTLVMVTSKSNIEQSIGRIQRKMEYPDERPPLVIDLVDNFSSFQSQSIKRDIFYRKNNYNVTNFIFDYNNSNRLYSDFEEGIKNFSQYSENSEFSELEDYKYNKEQEDCKYNKEQEDNKYNKKQEYNKEKSSKNKLIKNKNVIIQTKIDSSLYNMIGDGNFDI